MTVPVITAIINFSTGPSFASPLILGSGILGTNALATSATVSVDVSSLVNLIEIRRGRNVTADLFQAGTLSLRILDQNGDFNPMNVSGPYYGLLNPMRKITVTASFNGVTYGLFAGYISNFNTVTPTVAGDLVYTTISAIDAFQLANLATITAVVGAVAGETTGARIGRILDQISWPSSMRDIDAGLTTVQADPGTSRNALAAMQTVETTEYGALYIDPFGKFVFQDRALTATSAATTPVVFSDTGSDIGYANAVWVLNADQIYNSANVTRTGGTLQSAEDSASIDLFFRRSVNYTGLLMESDTEALNFARAYIASRKDTTVRCDALTLDLYSPNYDAGITAALSLDFFDPVKITTTQPNSTALVKTEQVFGVAHSITPTSWRTTFQTLEPIIDSFILNSALHGVLGTSVLAY